MVAYGPLDLSDILISTKELQQRYVQGKMDYSFYIKEKAWSSLLKKTRDTIHLTWKDRALDLDISDFEFNFAIFSFFSISYLDHNMYFSMKTAVVVHWTCGLWKTWI